MKTTIKLIALYLLSASTMLMTSCDDGETYADQKNRERDIINAFIERDTHITVSGEELCHVGKITVISEEEFLKDTVTQCQLDAEGNYIANEYVQLNNGLYMQIVRRGVGEELASGTSVQLVARYIEYNMSMAYITTRNTTNEYHRFPDIIDATNNFGTITGSFNTALNGGGAMYRAYGTTTVPEAWLTALRYLRLGRQTSPDEGIAKVRLIVPHTLGHSTATSNVHPYFYEITFQRLHD